jgi:hypothetical protein
VFWGADEALRRFLGEMIGPSYEEQIRPHWDRYADRVGLDAGRVVEIEKTLLYFAGQTVIAVTRADLVPGAKDVIENLAEVQGKTIEWIVLNS